MNVMNAKVNQNNGDSLFNSIMSKNNNSNSSKFNNILSSKESDNMETKESKKRDWSKEKQFSKNSKAEVSKKEDNNKTKDNLDEDNPKSINKELENLLMSLIQIIENPIQLKDVDLNMEESELLNLIEENLELLLETEHLQDLDLNGLSRELTGEENLSEILVADNGDLLDKLKELIRNDSSLEVDSKYKDIKTDEETTSEIETNNLGKEVNLNLETDKQENPIESEDEKELEVKVEKRDSGKSEKSEIKEETKVETKSSDGIRIDINTEVRSKSNMTMDPVVNDSTEIDVNEEDVIKQITDKIQINMGEGTSEIKLSLKPKILGDMIMNLQVTEGEVVAKVFVENHKTKQIIEANLVLLQEEIKDTGMEIKTFEVFVGSNTDYEQPNQGQSNFFSKNKKNRFKANKEDINLISSNYEAGTMENKGPSLLLDGQSMDLQA